MHALPHGRMMEDKMGQEEKKQAADAAMSDAFAVAERVAMLLDRHAGDNGDAADVIEDWTHQLCQLEREIYKVLGTPRTRLPGGGLVPTSSWLRGAA